MMRLVMKTHREEIQKDRHELNQVFLFLMFIFIISEMLY